MPGAMAGVVRVPASLSALQSALTAGLARVEERFERELRSEIPDVARLVAHVERYRGKMLRPSLVLTCGLLGAGSASEAAITDELAALGAVCEMVHMATLVHDDVLDDASTRRQGPTVNRLAGNESAVMLGDLLIAGAFHLCSTLGVPRYAIRVGEVAKAMCSGELQQLSRRGDWTTDEPTYFEIIERKTASLIALSCELGAIAGGATDDASRRLAGFGLRLGSAFQIQDDILDLTGDDRLVGKATGQDLAGGKITLPVIHHLRIAAPARRAATIDLLAALSRGEAPARADLLIAVEETDSIEHARNIARGLVADAKRLVRPLGDSAPMRLLDVMADAVVDRAR